MKILHVTQEMFKTSGVATFCREIAAEQVRAGHEVLALVQGNYDLKFDEGVKVVVGPSMEMLGVRPDIMHIHGLWAPFSARAMTWCRQRGIPYVVSPHGCLMPRVFKKGWLKKHLFWWLMLRRGVGKASLFHFTAEAERQAVARFGFEVPSVIAPLGVRIRTQVASQHAELAKSDVPTTGVTLPTAQSAFCQGSSRRALAERNVEEWLEGVTRESFCVALGKLVDEKSVAGEYRFNRDAERVAAVEGAKKFFDQFARKIVQLSDGRCVYFVPDARAKNRNKDNATSWAEYAFHAVSNGGARIQGKGYNERLYNPHKAANFNLIETTLLAERCYVRLASDSRYDAIMFDGGIMSGLSFQVVARLDVCGNIEANLTEVTFTSSSKRVKKAPRLVALAEAVQAVVHHQTTPGSCPQDNDIIPNLSPLRNGGRQIRTCLFLGRISDEKGLSLLLDAWKRLSAADWRLEIAGPDWRGYRALLEKKVAEEEIRGVEFHDPVFGSDKDALYRNADLFALASPVENFSAVVLDALAFGVPVICTKGTPWGCIERENCGWWVEPNSSAALYEALKSATSLPGDELRKMGQCGIAVAQRDYNWETISRTLLKGYEGVSI